MNERITEQHTDTYMYISLRWDALRSETPGGEIWHNFYFMDSSVQNNNLLMFYAIYDSMLII